MFRLEVVNCPQKFHPFNCVVINSNFFKDVRYIKVIKTPNNHFVFTVKKIHEIPHNAIGFTYEQLKWARLSLSQEIEVQPYQFDATSDKQLSKIILEADFRKQKTIATSEPYNTDEMAKAFLLQFSDQIFTVGQQLAFHFKNKKLLKLVVKCLETADLSASTSQRTVSKRIKMGRLGDTVIQFGTTKNSTLNLVGQAKEVFRQSIINPDWDFYKMGIGGLDKEISTKFKKAFASRFSSTKMDCNETQVNGILLYGSRGTGKTLMAQQIAAMLSARKPKVIYGFEILNKCLEQSEANIRRMFADAEEEEKTFGPTNDLRVIVCEGIDSICQCRSRVGKKLERVCDRLVNQMCIKFDDVKKLQNIIVIGTTYGRDMIDDALLKPDRFGLEIEMKLPDKHGRYQILNIHTCKMKENNQIAPDVDLEELAIHTKDFSGAQLKSLITNAESIALRRDLKTILNRYPDARADVLSGYFYGFTYAYLLALTKNKSNINEEENAMGRRVVTNGDFFDALKSDIKPHRLTWT